MKIDISLDLTPEQFSQFKKFIGYGYTGMIHHECKTAEKQQLLIDLTNQLSKQLELNEPDEDDFEFESCWNCGSTDDLEYVPQQTALLCIDCRSGY